MGRYYNEYYGFLYIYNRENEYFLNFGTLNSRITHVYDNVYILADLGDDFTSILPGIKYIYFAEDNLGNIVSATIECIVSEGSGIFIKK